MPRKPTARMLAACGLAAVLIAAGCNRGGDDDPDVEVTDAPSPTPAAEAIADFQIVGRIDESLVGQEPSIDTSEVDFDVDFDDDDADASPDVSPTPEPTPVGEQAPEEGVMRVEAEAV